jgi:hypothetical protein
MSLINFRKYIKKMLYNLEIAYTIYVVMHVKINVKLL